MDVVCLKWGDKFNHEHVNKLYHMVCKNLDCDFNFICYTENSNDIDSNISKKRLVKLQTLLEKNNSKSKEEFLNKTTEVLFENKLNNEDKYFGRDKFLNSVIVQSKKNLTGKILDIKINAYNRNSLFGKILPNEKFSLPIN